MEDGLLSDIVIVEAFLSEPVTSHRAEEAARQTTGTGE